jgi:signal transduction histidine kinase
LPHVWERYYKSSTNHVRATKGSGIGLSIVKEILLAHNARFGVESKVGRGTTFWFELEVVPEVKPVKKKHHLLHR